MTTISLAMTGDADGPRQSHNDNPFEMLVQADSLL